MAFGDLIALADRAAQSHLGGVTVLYTPVVGAAVSVTGIFDENYTVIDGFNGTETHTPAVLLRLEDLPTDPRDEDPALTILGLVYSVRARETDGTIGGAIRLLLRRSDL